MSEPFLVTKLFMPPPRPRAILRPRLVRRLAEGLGRGRSLSLVSAPAGFGKTSLVGEWAGACGRPIAWLSLDEGDGDLSRFLLYLASALRVAEPDCCGDELAALQSSHPPPAESVLSGLVNEIDGFSRDILLVLDDYHAVDSVEVDGALGFLLEHLPPRLHLVVSSREDPDLPLARLRANDRLTELRAADLRFTPQEASEFLETSMGLELEEGQATALEERTEGWVAGLQLAALSLEGREDVAGRIAAFAGSNRFALDYLAEEVLRHLDEASQDFLIKTSVLERLCGSLCDALLRGAEVSCLKPGVSGQETLEALERANLFIVPLDREGKWYRYHGLFAELLRQRLGREGATGLHVLASQWFEGEGLYSDAFHHAKAAGDLDRAERLATSGKMPIHFPGTVATLLDWVSSLSAQVLDGRPALRVLFATSSLAAGRTAGVEESLEAAEQSLLGLNEEGWVRGLLGRIAAARATLALSRYEADAIIAQACRALEYLPDDDLSFRFTAVWTMAFGHALSGDRAAAGKGFGEALALSKVSGDLFSSQLALCSIGEVKESDTRLHEAAETYRHALALFGEHPLPNACEAHLGLARILYEWNELDAATEEAEKALSLSRHYDKALDRFIPCELFLARIMLAQRCPELAAARLEGLAVTARTRGFMHRLPEIAALQIEVLLNQGEVEAAALLSGAYELPVSRARVLLAKGEASEAHGLLEGLVAQMETRGWKREGLGARVLLSLALFMEGQVGPALHVLDRTLKEAEGGGFIRLFLDEGQPMAALMSIAAVRGTNSAYAGFLLKLLRAGEGFHTRVVGGNLGLPSLVLFDPLSQRELEVLGLIAKGLSNHEIGERLFLALDTVKGHNRRIFDKLEVKRRTEAVARARELGLL